MYESSEKAFKKFMKSREPASKASIRASKDQNFLVFHPDFIENNISNDTLDLLE